MTPKVAAVLAKKGVAPVSELTAYDYPTARLLDEAGIDIILVGDSLGNVMMGFPDTTYVTMDHMLHHCACVARGAKRALVIGDMPIHSFDTPELAVANARRLMAVGVDAVKLEGGVEKEEVIRAIVADGIPVQAHIGLLPQKVVEEGGYHMKGKTDAEAAALLRDMEAVVRAGAFSIVIECTRSNAAAAITKACPVITIGIGAGHGTCDGEVLVFHDVMGESPWFTPKFVTKRADLAAAITQGAKDYMASLRLPE